MARFARWNNIKPMLRRIAEVVVVAGSWQSTANAIQRSDGRQVSRLNCVIDSRPRANLRHMFGLIAAARRYSRLTMRPFFEPLSVALTATVLRFRKTEATGENTPIGGCHHFLATALCLYVYRLGQTAYRSVTRLAVTAQSVAPALVFEELRYWLRDAISRAARWPWTNLQSVGHEFVRLFNQIQSIHGRHFSTGYGLDEELSEQ